MRETQYLVVVEPRDYGVAPYLMTAEALGRYLENMGDAVHTKVYRFVRHQDPEPLVVVRSKKAGWWLEDMYGNFVVTLAA